MTMIKKRVFNVYTNPSDGCLYFIRIYKLQRQFTLWYHEVILV